MQLVGCDGRADEVVAPMDSDARYVAQTRYALKQARVIDKATVH